MLRLVLNTLLYSGEQFSKSDTWRSTFDIGIHTDVRGIKRRSHSHHFGYVQPVFGHTRRCQYAIREARYGQLQTDDTRDTAYWYQRGDDEWWATRWIDIGLRNSRETRWWQTECSSNRSANWIVNNSRLWSADRNSAMIDMPFTSYDNVFQVNTLIFNRCYIKQTINIITGRVILAATA